MNILGYLGVLVCGATTFLGTAFAGETKEFKFFTSDGRSLSAVVHSPENLNTPKAVVVIAPGQGYHRDRPLVKDLAESAAARGYLAVRFDWAYCQKDPSTNRCTGGPSDELVNEGKDLQATYQFVKSLSESNGLAFFLVGKSLGSIVGFQEFTKNSDWKGLILLTPVCTSQDDKNLPVLVGPTNYPGLQLEKRPVMVVKGHSDPLCETKMLYEWITPFNQSIPAVVLGGDHSLNVNHSDSTKANSLSTTNVGLAVDAMVQWMELQL